MNYGVKPQKQTVFVAKSTKKHFLLTNSGVITSILGVSGLELLSSSSEPVNFFEAQSSIGGHNSRLGGHEQWFGGHSPRMPSRGAGPAWLPLEALPGNDAPYLM